MVDTSRMWDRCQWPYELNIKVRLPVTKQPMSKYGVEGYADQNKPEVSSSGCVAHTTCGRGGILKYEETEFTHALIVNIHSK